MHIKTPYAEWLSAGRPLRQPSGTTAGLIISVPISAGTSLRLSPGNIPVNGRVKESNSEKKNGEKK